MEKVLNIYQKLAKIRKPVEVLQKNKEGFNYRYVTEDLILSKITAGMEKYGVSLIPSIVPNTAKVEPRQYTEVKYTKDGKAIEKRVNEMVVGCEMVWTWIDNDNPDSMVKVPWYMVGQQADVSQAFGSGLSYSSRYFMLKYFNVATSDDDPDKWRADQEKARKQEDDTISKEIINEVHTIVNSFLQQCPDKRADIENTIKQYATKNGKPSVNYFNIKDPETASNLLNEVRNKYKKEE